MDGIGALGGLFILGGFAVAFGGLIAWLLALVDAAHRPEEQYKAIGWEKPLIVLILAVLFPLGAPFIGALGYWLYARPRLIEGAKAGTEPAPPGTGSGENTPPAA